MTKLDSLNTFLSNLAVLTYKLHNLHWNVTGPSFVQIHEFTEKLYDTCFEQYDEVAEILKMQNEMPLVKMTDYLAHATIKEINAQDFTEAEVVKIVDADIKEMSRLAREIREIADKEGDFHVVSVFEDYLKAYAKNLWFLKAMQK